MTDPRDIHRSAVYAAEDLVTALLDRGGTVDFHGSHLNVPMQKRFGDLASVRRYLDAVRDCSWGAGDTPPPVIRHRKGLTKAHWSAPDSIAIPADAEWAMTEMVVLHEYAHHVTWHRSGDSGHDRAFCMTMRELVAGALGESAALVLLASYHESGALSGAN